MTTVSHAACYNLVTYAQGRKSRGLTFVVYVGKHEMLNRVQRVAQAWHESYAFVGIECWPNVWITCLPLMTMQTQNKYLNMLAASSKAEISIGETAGRQGLFINTSKKRKPLTTR